jgi:peptide/nickel transport system substrate-binding protein
VPHRIVPSRTAAALSAGVLLAGALAACSSSGGDGGGGGDAGKPVDGGNLVIARTADSESMNNTTVFDNESIWVFENIFQTLYTVSENGKSVTPELATGYTVSSDKKTYTFTLRKGVDFSDGTPMTSKDVVFSIDQARKASQGWGYIDTAIKDVEADGTDKVVVDLKYPWAPLVADLSLFANGIVPDNYGGKSETAFYDAPVGTGPFKWDYWHKGSELKLVKNTHYWKPGLPHLDSVAWTKVPDDNTRLNELKGGQAQVDEFPAWSTVQELQNTPGVTMNLFPSTRTDYLLMNEHLPMFQNVHVRQAISDAINRQALVKAVLFGNGKPANSLFPPQVPYYQSSTPGLQYDMTKAKQAMAQAGQYAKGFSTDLLIPAGESDDATIAQIIQSNLKPLGITVNIKQEDANTANTDEQSLKYDMTLSYWTMDIPDPDELATFAVDPTAGSKSFFTAYDDPAVVKDAQAAERTLSTSQRTRLYDDLQNKTASDAFLAWLYYSPYAYATSSNLHDFKVTPLGNYYQLENAWLSS